MADEKVTFLLDHSASFWYGLAAFAVFAFLIAKYGIGPIVRAIDARDARIKEQLNEAEQTYSKAKELQAKLDAELGNAESRISEMMKEARRDAEAAKAAIVEEGRAEADVQRERALRDIEAARYQAVVALREEVAEVATLVAEKILRGELDAAKHRDLVTAAIDDFEQRAGG